MNIHLHDVFGYIQNLAIENTKLKEENSELKDIQNGRRSVLCRCT